MPYPLPALVRHGGCASGGSRISRLLTVARELVQQRLGGVRRYNPTINHNSQPSTYKSGCNTARQRQASRACGHCGVRELCTSVPKAYANKQSCVACLCFPFDAGNQYVM